MRRSRLMWALCSLLLLALLANMAMWGASVRSTTLTKENFDMIQIGMTVEEVDLILGSDNRFPASGSELEQKLLYVGDENALVPATVIEITVRRRWRDEALRVTRKSFWAPSLGDKWNHVWNQIELQHGP
jgi:hypothetical protein